MFVQGKPVIVHVSSDECSKAGDHSPVKSLSLTGKRSVHHQCGWDHGTFVLIPEGNMLLFGASYCRRPEFSRSEGVRRASCRARAFQKYFKKEGMWANYTKVHAKTIQAVKARKQKGSQVFQDPICAVIDAKNAKLVLNGKLLKMAQMLLKLQAKGEIPKEVESKVTVEPKS